MATHSADIRESLAVPGEVILPNGWRIEAQPVANLDAERIADRAEQWQAYVDAERAGHLFVRTRHRGERMQPLGMQGKHSKVADMMVNAKIPARLRGGWPIVANASHVVWLVGIQVDERVKVHANTRRVIQLRCVKPPS
jgi:tRNA(Ile)-lysidine synthase